MLWLFTQIKTCWTAIIFLCNWALSVHDQIPAPPWFWLIHQLTSNSAYEAPLLPSIWSFGFHSLHEFFCFMDKILQLVSLPCITPSPLPPFPMIVQAFMLLLLPPPHVPSSQYLGLSALCSFSSFSLIHSSKDSIPPPQTPNANQHANPHWCFPLKVSGGR